MSTLNTDNPFDSAQGKLIPPRFTDEEIKSIKNILSTKSEIVIITHHRPDGDAMGSSLGLYHYLKLKGYSANLIVPSEFPDFLAWLPGSKEVFNFEVDKNKCEVLISKAQLIFCLDFNWLNRVDQVENLLRNSTAKKILIDHHLEPEKAFDVSLSYPDASSTAELIYDFINGLGDAAIINKEIASCIYCGIMTDTNSFRYSSMKARTHRIIAGLMESGAENYLIHENVYDHASESRLRLLGYILSEKLVVLNEFKTAYIALSEEEQNRFKINTGDTEGFVNIALSIKGIRLAGFFSEKNGTVKISLRSKGDFSVKEMTSKYFNGGGHKNASGGSSNEPLAAVVKKFIELLPKYKSELVNAG